MTVVTGGKAIVVGSGGQEYQVITISNESSLTQCGGLDIATGVRGVSSVLEADGDTYSYIVTGDASSELKIIEGGPGGGFSSQGTFESATFDAGASVAFNRFVAGATKSDQTDITYQVAGAPAVGDSCSGITFTFVGPDGTASTQFATSSAIPLSDDSLGYENPARCFRYKALLTSQDNTQTPVLTDMTINYSP